MVSVAPDPAVMTEIFAPPSAEQERLVRRVGWLVSPEPGQDGRLGRFLRMVIVAPMTQCTFLSFDLQLFLYGVFHTTIWARLGHFVFQTAVTFFLLVATAGYPGGHLWFGGLLLGWYAAMAVQYRLWAWVAVMVPYVMGMVLAAGWVAGAAWVDRPLVWALGSALVVAASHAPEPFLPPRTVEGNRWRSIREYVLESPDLSTSRWLRALRVALFSLWGTLDELWASPRLVPYGVLLLMFRAGYRPDLSASYEEWVRRAWASKNPALDFVGIGGGAYLRER